MSLSQNYPTTRPTLTLDFAKAKRVDPRVTFTRASTATYFDASGTLRSAADNAPRIDFNPSTLLCQGLLIEESRTNLCIYSEDFTYANWLVTNGTKTTGVSDPWGGSTAATLTATVGLAGFQNAMATVVIGTVYTVSCWMRRRTGTGAVGIRAVENVNTPVTITGTWARYSVTVTATQTIGRAGVFVQTIGDEIDVWGFQLEAGAFPTSYIPTTTTSLTRSADVASVTTLSPWFNASEGTIYAESLPFSITNQRIASFNDGSTSNRIIISRGTASGGNVNGNVSAGGSPQVSALIFGASLPAETFTKTAFAYKLDDFAGSVNGSAAVTDTSGTIPTVNILALGSGEALGNN
jgi:hypothetical protein